MEQIREGRLRALYATGLVLFLGAWAAIDPLEVLIAIPLLALIVRCAKPQTRLPATPSLAAEKT